MSSADIEVFPLDELRQRVQGVAGLLQSKVVSRILSVPGTFIAGGLVRHLLQEGSTTALYQYFSSRGDIDVFFQDSSSLVRLQTLMGGSWRPTVGCNGLQSDVVIDWGGHYSATCTVQLITCRHGTPSDVIGEFDFVNCAAAFDSDHLYVHRDLVRLESARELEVQWDSPYLASRVSKYVRRYGYTTFGPRIRSDLSTWVAARQALDDWKTRSHNGPKVLSDILVGAPVLLDDSVLTNMVGKTTRSVSLLHGSNYTQRAIYVPNIDLAQVELTRRREGYSSSQLGAGAALDLPGITEPCFVVGPGSTAAHVRVVLPDGIIAEVIERYILRVHQLQEA